MTIQEPSYNDSSSRGTAATLIRGALAGLLGMLAAVLVSCGSTGAGLIPAGSAGPLQSDFEAIARAAETGNGSCAATESAVAKTEADFNSLPASVDSGLRTRLREGITHLRSRALILCAQPIQQPTVTSTTKTTPTVPTTTSTPTTTTPTTPTVTTPTTPTTTPTTTGPEGGTPAPGTEPAPGGQGGTEPGAGGSGGAGAGQEGGK
ncbi:MAG TPA: hypothetical protein VNZ01_03805 [Solirubrobacteraceae bacterium]|jgi:hypothetical protein|nr:hypothetical protein [Solirubrobacteraceae bacterium]